MAIKVLTNNEVARSGHYTCPTCRAQSTADKDDTGWIVCPMLNDQIICMGCCFDFEWIARSENFDEHPAREDLEEVAMSTGKDIDALRMICLLHQERLYLGEIERADDSALKTAMHSQFSAVRALIHSINEP